MDYRQFQIARIFGIPLIIDYRWPLVVVLHIWLVSQFWMVGKVRPPLPMWQNLLTGTIITGLFFASVLIHELGHALIARWEGIQILDIQLHIFGGWARLANEPRTAMAEFRVAIAGPSASFLLALLFLAGLLLVQQASPLLPGAHAAAAALLYLSLANLMLAMFNLLPGLPLDGGRALRAWLWHRRGDILSATRTTARLGVVIAYMLISYGLFVFGYGIVQGRFWQNFVVALWMLIIGLFLKNAAEADYRSRETQQTAQPAALPEEHPWKVSGTVGEVMQTPPIAVSPELQISEFIDYILTHNRQTSFAVALEGRLHGVLSLARLRELPEERWAATTVHEMMEPIRDDLFIHVRASIQHARHKIQINSFGFLAVIDQDGLLIGHLTEADVNRAA
ncbi:MAG: site-2 protease family protein [Blastocatellia bacterium]|nr:site-2 protease family protein [Blastocatellia bacterium]